MSKQAKWREEWANLIGDHKFLAIKNWHKYQTNKTTQYILDYVDKEFVDEDYAALTEFERYLIDGLRRVRGRLRQNLLAHDLPTMTLSALRITRKGRPHVPHALLTLTSQGFLVPTNERDSDLEIHKIRLEKRREEDKESLTGEAATQEPVPMQEPVNPEPVVAHIESESEPGNPALKVASRFFVLMGKPKAHTNSAAAWEKQIAPLLTEECPPDRMKAIMEFAVTENDYSAEYLRLALDPMASFVKNFESLARRYDAMQAALAAKAKTANKIKSAGSTKTAPGAHGHKSGMTL